MQANGKNFAVRLFCVLIDNNGNTVVEYKYDAWGNHKVVNSSGVEITDQNHIGNLNPFRYRGYYYDVETGLYFLQTRYYDPVVGRFLNRDSVDYANPEKINGFNLYAYCLNNPVELKDSNGYFPISVWSNIFGFITDLASGFSRIMLNASIKAFESIAGISMYLLDSSGGAIFNPTYYKGVAHANKLLYGGKVLSTIGKAGNYVGYAFFVLDIGLSLYNNITNPNLSLSQKVTDSIVDVSLSMGTTLIGIGLTALGGLFGPFGVVVGAGASLALNIGISIYQSSSEYNKAKKDFNDFIVQTWNDVVMHWNYFWSFDWI